MNTRLQLILIAGTLAFSGFLIRCLVRKRLHLKYCLVWIFAILMMLVSAIFSNLVGWIATLMGIKTPSNLIFVMYGLFTLLIVFSLTAIVSHMNARIFCLVQHQAILEERLRCLEERLRCLEEVQKKKESTFFIEKESQYESGI